MNKSHTEATLRELCAYMRNLQRAIATRDPAIGNTLFAGESADYWRGAVDVFAHVAKLIETDYLPTQPARPRLQLVRNELSK